ncbi:hypothetical protein Enr13x_14910 [Stieleria neptunia]|uniref:YbjN domain-containing protein n=1 Tax=Stieleria neptunia TaxID=2527979 RepID=A0A518HLG5_9BACT|nr:YbjN domain-containing protein [Stieleria neptunia]QDV41648.1 hypothetical protein Enr13x_14910 [Stieleria neptunia]
MPINEVLRPSDLTAELLDAIFEPTDLEVRRDNDGDLVVTRGVSCYVMQTAENERLMLMTFVGVKENTDRSAKLEFVNRVNNDISTVRAHVNERESIVFDYHIPIRGGIGAEAIVEATRFFLLASAHAIDRCDQDDIVR